MNGFADVWPAGYGFQGCVAHVLGVGGGKTDTHVWNSTGYQLKQGRKIYLSMVVFVKIRINILSQ